MKFYDESSEKYRLNLIMVSEKHCWDILKNNFETKGFVHHQTESFNNFINEGISKIVTEGPPIVISSKSKDDDVFYQNYSIDKKN